jgi:hypothetical protein
MRVARFRSSKSHRLVEAFASQVSNNARWFAATIGLAFGLTYPLESFGSTQLGIAVWVEL